MHQQTSKATNSTNGDDDRAAYQDGRGTQQACRRA